MPDHMTQMQKKQVFDQMMQEYMTPQAKRILTPKQKREREMKYQRLLKGYLKEKHEQEQRHQRSEHQQEAKRVKQKQKQDLEIMKQRQLQQQKKLRQHQGQEKKQTWNQWFSQKFPDVTSYYGEKSRETKRPENKADTRQLQKRLYYADKMLDDFRRTDELEKNRKRQHDKLRKFKSPQTLELKKQRDDKRLQSFKSLLQTKDYAQAMSNIPTFSSNRQQAKKDIRKIKNRKDNTRYQKAYIDEMQFFLENY